MEKVYTKEELVAALKFIRNRGWICSAREGNCGGVGNTLEDLLGIRENNLPIPNAAEWELKTQRLDCGSLTTLFHMEPSPTTFRFVSQILLPKYGWKHQQAGTKYPETEMSFRQTINAVLRTDRGFGLEVDHTERRVEVSFDACSVSAKHSSWKESVLRRIGLSELTPQPYWGFDDLYHKAGTKLHNCFFVQAAVRRINDCEEFWYEKLYMLQGFSFDKFIAAICKGTILVDFDARTGHNHGTKFRMREKRLPELYGNVDEF